MNDRPATLLKLWIKTAKYGPMQPVREANVVKDAGIVKNANQGGKRQITVISEEAFEAAKKELGKEFDPSVRRANLMVNGIDLKEKTGAILCIGELRLEVKGETRPCQRMDDAVPGLRKTLEPDWRGGLYGVALNNAVIKEGDAVGWE